MEISNTDLLELTLQGPVATTDILGRKWLQIGLHIKISPQKKWERETKGDCPRLDVF